jgi:hypothetical protein
LPNSKDNGRRATIALARRRLCGLHGALTTGYSARRPGRNFARAAAGWRWFAPWCMSGGWGRLMTLQRRLDALERQWPAASATVPTLREWLTARDTPAFRQQYPAYCDQVAARRAAAAESEELALEAPVTL